MRAEDLEDMMVQLMGDGSSYEAMLSKAKKSTEDVTKHIQIQTQVIEGFGLRLKGFAGSVSGAAVSAVAGFSALGGILKGIRLSAEAEKMESDFGVMLQSVELGKKMVKDLQRFAAETPLNMPDIQQATKTLLQFGVAGEDIIPTLRQLGDVALGDANKLQSLSLAFGQMRSIGHLQGGELLQMINAGFNPLQEIARTTGKSVEFLKQQMEKGGITLKMVEGAFKSATSAGGSFQDGMKKASMTLSGLFSTMQDDIDGLLRTIGTDIIETIHLKEAVAAVSMAAQTAAEWFTALDPAVKKAAYVAAGLAAVAGTLLLLWPLIAGAATTAFGTVAAVIGFLTTPLGLVIALATFLVVRWTQTVGGMAAAFEILKKAALSAWEYVKERFNEFVTWATPLWRAIEGIATAVWENIKFSAQVAAQIVMDMWDVASSFISDVFTALGLDTKGTWKDIRDFILEVLIGFEFYFSHMGDVWGVVLAGAKYEAVSLFAEFEHFFDSTLPTLLDWFSENWGAVFTDAFNSAETVAKNYFSNLVTLFTNLPGLISGSVNFGDLMFKDLTEGMAASFTTLPDIPKREIGELEKMLKEDYDQRSQQLGQSYEQFREAKLKEYTDVISGPNSAKAEEAANLAGQSGKKIGETFAKEAHKGKDKFDSALMGSAEALARIAEYSDLIRGTRLAGAFGGDLAGNLPSSQGIPSGGALPSFTGSQSAGPNSVSGPAGGKTELLLTDIRTNTKTLADKPGVVLKVESLT